MNIYLKGAALAAMLTAAVPALAQAVLTVDMDRLYADSAAGKAALTQMTARYQGPGQQINAAITAARTNYETQLQAAQKLVGPNGDESKITPAARQALAAAQDKFDDTRSQAAQLQQAIEASRSYVQSQINQQAIPLIEQVRSERKASVVLVRGTLPAADPATDITAAVLPRLDAKLTTVPIVPPQAAGPAGAAPAPAAKSNTQGR